MMPSLCPMRMAHQFWPSALFYDKQEEIVWSVEENVETYVYAGNQLGKDYIAGYVCVSLFLRCVVEGIRCRIITTSVKDDHLQVLWAEIGRWISSCKYPLREKYGGPLVELNKELRRAEDREAKNPDSYLKGLVSETGEGLSGHHADCTLFVADEASGVPQQSYAAAQGWAKRFLIFGNPNPCENFFKQGCEGGDLELGAVA